jgi:hypothetical protein
MLRSIDKRRRTVALLMPCLAAPPSASADLAARPARIEDKACGDAADRLPRHRPDPRADPAAAAHADDRATEGQEDGPCATPSLLPAKPAPEAGR